MVQLHRFSNGTLADADEVNVNTEFVLGRLLDSNRIADTTTGTIKGYEKQAPITSGSTIGIIALAGGPYGGTVYSFEGSSYDSFTGAINTTRYTYTATTSAGLTSSGSGTGGGSTIAYVNADFTGLSTAAIEINEDFGVSTYPGSTTVQIDCDATATSNGAWGAGYAGIEYGGVILHRATTDNSPLVTGISGVVTCVFSHNKQTMYVYLGSPTATLGSTISITGSTSGKFKVIGALSDNDGPDAAVTIRSIRVNPPIGGSSTSGSIVFSSTGNGWIGSWLGSGVLTNHIYIGGANGSYGTFTENRKVSADNGATWTTINSSSDGKITMISSTNSGSLRFMNTYTYGSPHGFMTFGSLYFWAF